MHTPFTVYLFQCSMLCKLTSILNTLITREYNKHISWHFVIQTQDVQPTSHTLELGFDSLTYLSLSYLVVCVGLSSIGGGLFNLKGSGHS